MMEVNLKFAYQFTPEQFEFIEAMAEKARLTVPQVLIILQSVNIRNRGFRERFMQRFSLMAAQRRLKFPVLAKV